MNESITPSQAFSVFCTALRRHLVLSFERAFSACYARIAPILNEVNRSRDKEIVIFTLFLLYKFVDRYKDGAIRSTKSFYSASVNFLKEVVRLALPGEDTTGGRCKTVGFVGACSWAGSRIELFLRGEVTSYLAHLLVSYYVFTLPLLTLSNSLDTRVGELKSMATVPLPPQIVLSVVDGVTTAPAQANPPPPPLARPLGPVQEMAIAGAHNCQVPDNKSLAVIARKVDGSFEMVGQCFCVSDSNSTSGYRIFTADHVLSKSEANYLVSNTKTFVIDESIVIRSANDIAFFDLPLGVKATLGVRNLEMGSLDFNAPVSVTYLNGGDTYRSTGSVTRGEKGEILTRFSTFPSVSGAVILQNSKAVGIHLGAKPDEGFNYGRSLIKFLKKIEVPRAGMILPPASVQERIGSTVAHGRDWEESYFNMTDFQDVYRYSINSYPELFKHFDREIAEDLQHAFKRFDSDYDDYEATQRRHMMDELREAEEDDGYTPNSAEVRKIARKYAQIFSGKARESATLPILEKNKKPFEVSRPSSAPTPLKEGGMTGPRVTVQSSGESSQPSTQKLSDLNKTVRLSVLDKTLESLSQSTIENKNALSLLATRLDSLSSLITNLAKTETLSSSGTAEEELPVQESVNPVASRQKRKKSSTSTITQQTKVEVTSTSSPSTAPAPSPSLQPKSSGTSVVAKH